MRTQVARYSASAAAASDATPIAAAAILPEVGVAILRDARRPQHGNYSAAGNNKHVRARWQPLAPATLSSGGLCRGPCITTRQHNFPTPRRPRIFRVGAKSRGYTTTLQNMHPARRLPLPALPPFSSGGLLPSSSRCNAPPQLPKCVAITHGRARAACNPTPPRPQAGDEIRRDEHSRQRRDGYRHGRYSATGRN